jgi:hypothetical protein
MDEAYMYALKTFVFRRKEKSKWLDILKDAEIKRWLQIKIIYDNILILQLNAEMPSRVETYLQLKWSDELTDTNQLIPDRTPRMYVDYYPRKSKIVDIFSQSLETK